MRATALGDDTPDRLTEDLMTALHDSARRLRVSTAAILANPAHHRVHIWHALDEACRRVRRRTQEPPPAGALPPFGGYKGANIALPSSCCPRWRVAAGRWTHPCGTPAQGPAPSGCSSSPLTTALSGAGSPRARREHLARLAASADGCQAAAAQSRPERPPGAARGGPRRPSPPGPPHYHRQQVRKGNS
jgi:hypothetical protein